MMSMGIKIFGTSCFLMLSLPIPRIGKAAMGCNILCLYGVLVLFIVILLSASSGNASFLVLSLVPGPRTVCGEH